MAEYASDQRLGLLRLARTLKEAAVASDVRNIEISAGPVQDVWTTDQFFDARRELREFITAAVLVGGQTFAPLLPPITHDGVQVGKISISPDQKTLMTLGWDGTARLWDVRTARPMAVLRQSDECVVRGEFSPDSRTAFTDDENGVARFWDVPTGTCRAATEPRPRRYQIPKSYFRPVRGVTLSLTEDATRLTSTRLLTKSVVLVEHDDDLQEVRWEGPVELWDTATGYLIARLDQPNSDVQRFQFVGDGRWIATTAGESTVLIFSASNGDLLGRLEHPAGISVESLDASPDGGQVATAFQTADGKAAVQLWDTRSWTAKSATMTIEGARDFRFWTDDVFSSQQQWGAWSVQRFGEAKPLGHFSGGQSRPAVIGDLTNFAGTTVYDIRKWRWLRPEEGRKFHEELARFAPDGRFVYISSNSIFGRGTFIDTRTEKEMFGGDGTPPGLIPGFALVWAIITNGGSAEIEILPPVNRLAIPAEQLELWTQVVVRGEMSEAGEFIAWDEPQWERKREELAATATPFPDFPFPGFVATDRLHWLRAEYFAAPTEAEKQRLAGELLRRAETSGNQSEAARWKAIIMQVERKDEIR